MKINLQTLSWLLFLLCGFIYLVAAVRDGDGLMIAGTACFIVAVIIFLFPGHASVKKEDTEQERLRHDKVHLLPGTAADEDGLKGVLKDDLKDKYRHQE